MIIKAHPDFKSADKFNETAVFFPLDLVSENAPSRRSGRFPLHESCLTAHTVEYVNNYDQIPV